MEIDQIFVGIHIRCARLVSSLVPRPVRSVLQASSLLLSLFLLTSLIWLHHQHIHPQGTHYQPQPQPHPPNRTAATAASSGTSFTSPSNGGFPSLVDWMQGSDVLRVIIEAPSVDYAVWQGTDWSSWWSNERDRISVHRQSYKAKDAEDAVAIEENEEEQSGRENVEDEYDTHQLMAVQHSAPPSSDQSTTTVRHVSRPPNFSSSPALSPRRHSQSTPAYSSPSALSSPTHVYEYAHHKGYFLLPASLYARHRVVTTTVRLSASHPAFGPFPLPFVTYHLFGYDSIILNHLIRQMRVGFMRNARTNDMFTLSGSGSGSGGNNFIINKQQQHPHDTNSTSSFTSTLATNTLNRLFHLLYLLFFKSELLVTTLFLFFATTTLVSSTLTQTQLRMLHFTDQLRQHIRLHLPIVGLVLEHTMQSLSFVPVVVGILFFLFEFFNDQVLAFLLLMLVWLCESYTVLFTRTTTSMLYFPKLFALYFLMFGVYFFSFPYGFHYIAMGLTASQLYTCILYYWFQYEIPAVEAGDISIHRPRMLVLRRAEGGDRDRDEHSAVSGARANDSAQRAESYSSGTVLQRERDSSAGRRREELFARLLNLISWCSDLSWGSAHDGVPVDQSSAARDRHQPMVLEDSDVDVDETLEFSRRPLPRISISSTNGPARSALSTGPASAASFSSSSLPVPSALSTSSSAPGQAVGRLSMIVPELASPVPSTSSTSLTASAPPPSTASSPSSHSSVQPDGAVADAALQRMQTLPALLHTLLRHTQQLKVQYAAPPSPRHAHLLPSSRRRTRAASAVSPTLSPLANQDEAVVHDLISLASDEAKEQPSVTSPRSALPTEPTSLHKLVLDQLSNVLQVALHVLTTLVPNTHSSAATTTGPQSPPAWHDANSGGGSALLHSLPVPISPLARSPRSPRTSPTPPPAPRASPPSSHRTSSSFTTSVSSPPVRLVFSQLPSTGGASVSAMTTGEETGTRGSRAGGVAVHGEPVSPDPASDAPMM